MKTYLLLISLVLTQFVYAQKYGPEGLSDRITRHNLRNTTNTTQLFEFSQKRFRSNANDGIQLRMDVTRLNEIRRGAPEFLKLDIPINDKELLKLELAPLKVLANDFVLRNGNNREEKIKYNPGQYYAGIVSGHSRSTAVINFRDESMMGTITRDSVKFDLKPVQSGGHEYDLTQVSSQVTEPFSCDVADDGVPYTLEELSDISSPSSSARMAGARSLAEIVVRLYVEVDANFKGKGTGSFNEVTSGILDSLTTYIILPFQLEGINVEISELVVWDKSSQYYGSGNKILTPSDVLPFFKEMIKDGFHGDIGMLLGTGSGGGIAALSGLCQYEYSRRVGVAFNYPAALHEIGHLLGARHTHDCVWNGNGTAIDQCATGKGLCGPGAPIDPTQGTIMSYCVPPGGSLADIIPNGFGTQPGNVIRNNVLGAYCLNEPNGAPPFTYCPATGNTTVNPQNSTDEAYIDMISLNNYFKFTGNDNGYGNFLSDTITVRAGTSVPVSVHLNKGRFEFSPDNDGDASNDLTPNFVSVWIDLDGDYDFSDPDEMVFYVNNNPSAYLPGTVVIPAHAKEGIYRMRVMLNMECAGILHPCMEFEFGEVEDYTINILPQIDLGNCSTPSLDFTETVITPTSVRLNFRPVSTAGSYTVRYYGETDGLLLDSMVNFTSPPVVLTGLRPGTFYRYDIRANCSNGSSSAFSSHGRQFYTGSCVPSTLTVVPYTSNIGLASWTENPNSPVWFIRYREEGQEVWGKIMNPTSPVEIPKLQVNKNYEAQLISTCSEDDSTNVFYGAKIPFTVSDQFAVNFQFRNQWDEGATVDVTLTNLTGKPIDGWEIKFSISSSTITQVWGANLVQGNTSPYTLTNVGYNSSIPVNGSVTFGFNLARTANNFNFGSPNFVRVNGVPPVVTTTGYLEYLYTIEVLARGASGTYLEMLRISAGGNQVQTFVLDQTGASTYKAVTSKTGKIRAEFINDDGGDMDAEVWYVSLNGIEMHSDEQLVNTGVYQDGHCGGSYSMHLDCNGYIEYEDSFFYEIAVRARGTSGKEMVDITVGGTKIGSLLLGQNYETYTFKTKEKGGINVVFTNDASNRDVQVDYLQIIVPGLNTTTLQAENQSVNTGVYENGKCGGDYSEWMHCNGFIGFANSSSAARQAIPESEETEILSQNVIKVYPNPANDRLSIDLKTEYPVEVLFHSPMGRLMRHETITESTEMNISDLAAGLYLIEFNSKDFHTVQKLIKH